MDPHQQHPHHQHQHHQHHQQHHPLDIDHDHNQLPPQPYTFYQQPDATDPSQYGLPYPQHIPNYDLVQQTAPHPRHAPHQMSPTDFQQALQFRSLSLMPNNPFPQPPQVYPSSPPNDLSLSLASSSPSPQSPTAYDPLSPPVSGSDTSAENIYMSRNSSGTGSPSSSRGNSLVHRNPLRYNATSPSSSSGRRGRGLSVDSDEDERNNMIAVVQEIANNRKEATRKQRIEAEQRRRDELRDGYARLKDVLPVSNQKSSKVSLLERATNYIIQLDKTTRQMQTRLAALESEVQRLRSLNEKISLSVGSTPEAGMGQAPNVSIHNLDRPLSPPPESNGQHPSHSLTAVTGDPPREDSSGSEGGF